MGDSDLAVRAPGYPMLAPGRTVVGQNRGGQGTVPLKGEGSGSGTWQQMRSHEQDLCSAGAFAQVGHLLLCPWPCPCVLG